MMKINISAGELFDRMSILKIKRIMIVDMSKLAKVKSELNKLEKLASFYTSNSSHGDAVSEQFDLLINVNKNLWLVEDQLRIHEEKQEFDEDFITKARSVYRLNDRRYHIKCKIDSIVGEETTEVKEFSTV